MRAAIFKPYSVTVGQRPDPAIQMPTDAIVRVVLDCVSSTTKPGSTGSSPYTRPWDERRAIKSVVRVGST
ncbi:MAG: hypothetical protein ACLQK4_10135 [Acidimicrobiales bacterium]|jgi:hypothetical protein